MGVARSRHCPEGESAEEGHSAHLPSPPIPPRLRAQLLMEGEVLGRTRRQGTPVPPIPFFLEKGGVRLAPPLSLSREPTGALGRDPLTGPAPCLPVEAERVPQQSVGSPVSCDSAASRPHDLAT